MKFPYEKFRKGQEESINRIMKNLGKFIVFKAPTGFGKTIVALLSHLRANKVLYVVRTRNEMTPVIRELRKLNEPFTIVFSGRRMCPLLPKKNIRPEDFWINCKLVRTRGLCHYYQRLEDVDYDIVSDILKYSHEDPHEITRAIVRNLDACPFFALTNLIKYSKFVVATYPYLFREEVFKTAFSDVALDDYYVIIDEAHIVLNPQSLFEEEINENDVIESMKEVRNYGVGEEIWNYLSNLKDIMSKLRSDRLRRLDKSIIYPGEGIKQLLEDAILDIRLRKLQELISTSASELMSISTKLSKIVKFLHYASSDSFNVYGQVVGEGIKVIKALPIDYKPLKDRLKIVKGVLLMSGTMPPKEIVDYILSSDTYYIDVESDYGRIFPRSNLFISVFKEVTSSYRYRNESMYMKYSELIESIVEASPRGAILVIYPSYNFMNNVVSNVIVSNTIQVVEGKETILADVINRAIEGDKVVIHAVAGGKLSEGIEIRDPSKGLSLIKVVVIAGVPYPQPDDYIQDLRRRLESELPQEVARKLVMDVPAVIKVLQAIGRAIRSEKDRAFIVLADRRFLTPKLRKLLNLSYDLICSNIKILVNYLRRFHEGIL